MKQKKNIFIKKILIPTTSVAGIFCFLGSLSSCSITNFDPSPTPVVDDNIVPYNLLDIDENNVLKGFAPGVTTSDLRKGGWTTLQIPPEVVRIESNAFAMTFDGQGGNPVTHLSFDTATSLVSIGDDAFNFCKGLTGDIDFSKTPIKTIGNRAFMYDSSIRGVKFVHDDPKDDKLEKIGDSCFYGCMSLHCETTDSKLILPSSLQELGAHAFAEIYGANVNLDLSKYECPPKWMSCSASTFQNFSSGKALFSGKYVTLDDWRKIFKAQNDGSRYILVEEYARTTTPDDFETETDEKGVKRLRLKKGVNIHDFDVITIPDGIDATTIDNQTLPFAEIASSNYYLRLEIKSQNIKVIDNSAFDYCNQLHSPLILPDSVELIGSRAFCHCSNLSGILKLPNNSNLKIDDKAFWMSGLSGLCIPDQVSTNSSIFKLNSQTGNDDRIALGSFWDMPNLSYFNFIDNTKIINWDQCQRKDESERTFRCLNGYGFEKNKTATMVFTSKYLKGEPNKFESTSRKFDTIGWKTGFYTNCSDAVVESYKHTLMSDIGNENSITSEKDFYINSEGKIADFTETFYANKDNYSVIEIPNSAHVLSKKIFDGMFAGAAGDPYKIWQMNLPIGVVELEEKCLSNNSGQPTSNFACTTGLMLNPSWPVTLKVLNNPFEGNNYMMNGCLDIPPTVETINGLGLEKTNIYSVRLTSNLKHFHSAETTPDKSPLDFSSLFVLDLTDFTDPYVVDQYDWGKNVLSLPNRSNQDKGYILVYSADLMGKWRDIFNRHGGDPTVSKNWQFVYTW